jgi:hypothetical protein
MAPDVEALVVAHGAGYVVPVSAAFALAGELRTTWEGFTGGDAPTRALDAFLDEADARTRGNTSREPRRIASRTADGRER